ncbi:ATP-binding cassette domain-containing protein [Mariniluteicoccus flavus]
MTTWAIEATGLRKAYRQRMALNGLDLHVPATGVHGLIGPNASGNTTTIRALLGLTRLQEGTLHLLGEVMPQGRAAALQRIGAIVERPRFTGSFSGRKNLRLLADAAGLPRVRVDEALEAVGLRGREDERYSTYSLGLQQRIAVAACLLKRPELVIFDEPTNGLDPQGMHEVRTLMRTLADSGRAVLVSSHHLAEIAQVADTVTVIAQGRTLAEGDVASLTANTQVPTHLLRIDEPDRAAQVLTGHGWTVRPGQGCLEVTGTPPPSEIARQLAQEGLWLTGLETAAPDLEQAYFALTDHRLAGPR